MSDVKITISTIDQDGKEKIMHIDGEAAIILMKHDDGIQTGLCGNFSGPNVMALVEALDDTKEHVIERILIPLTMRTLGNMLGDDGVKLTPDMVRERFNSFVKQHDDDEEDLKAVKTDGLH